MDDLVINNYLVQENLFELFKQQLKKDFAGAGLSAGFTENLPSQFDQLKSAIVGTIDPLLANNFSQLSNLLYRVDISELQLQKYQETHPELPFEEVVAELIIKRVFQKIILKKTFSK